MGTREHCGEESISQLGFGDGVQPKHLSEIVECTFKCVSCMVYKLDLNKTNKDKSSPALLAVCGAETPQSLCWKGEHFPHASWSKSHRMV